MAEAVAMIALVWLLAAGNTGEPGQVPGLTDAQQLRQLTRAENQTLVVADTHELDTLLGPTSPP